MPESTPNPGFYTRPIPIIGDPTSANERAHDPAGWRVSDATRAGLYEVIEARRDIRRYRPDPIPADLLATILRAAHHGPSVGHSQPWRFIVVEDASIRSQAAVMADKARLDQAAHLAPDQARKLLDLQLEGIREAPLGIVVACDRRANPQGVLGRATFRDADMWSCACAIQNLWLAARAEGLGVGWVTLFEPDELAQLLHLPPGVETLGWLCVGYPDERPPEPGLVRQGWSKRLPINSVVATNHWPEQGFPDLLDYYEGIVERPIATPAPSQEEVILVKDRADVLLTPPGSLGLIDHALNKALSVSPEACSTARLVMVGTDHPVYAHRVSAFPQAVSKHIMDAAANGEAYGSIAAKANAMAVTVVDAGILGGVEQRPGAPVRVQYLDAPANSPALGEDTLIRLDVPDTRGDLVNEDAMSPELTEYLVAMGRAIAQSIPEATICLGEVGIGNTTVAAALTSALLAMQPEDTAGLGAGSDSQIIDIKAQVIAQSIQRLGPTTDPMRILGALGGPEFAVLTGVVLGAVQARKVVVMDGLAGSVPALLASRMDPGVPHYVVAGQRSRERAHAQVLRALGVEPILDVRIRAGEGIGGVLAAGLLMRTVQMRQDAAKTGKEPDGASGTIDV